MEGLQRSQMSFRRQGSSGLVWDDKLISGELNSSSSSDQPTSSDHQKSELKRSRSDGGGRRTYRTVKVDQAEDPPSPRLSACGFCSVFGNKSSANQPVNNRKSGNKRKV